MSPTINSSWLLSVVTFAYLAAALAYLFLLVFKKEVLGAIGFAITLGTVSVHTAAIIWRWAESYQIGPGYGHAPFSNLYESLIFFAWTIAAVYLIMERLYKNRAIGAFVLPWAFLAIAYAGLQPKEIMPLVPALKSNWLIAHVITCFLGYAGFALAAGLAVMYIVQDVVDGVRGTAGDNGPKSGFMALLPTRTVIDNLIYQNIVVGFLLLTAGIATGAIWAHTAWGTYWSWDPKETWSLITWFAYAAILHTRMVRGWTGRPMAVLALVGFSCVLFTYFGVNFLLEGLHSYATGK